MSAEKNFSSAREQEWLDLEKTMEVASIWSFLPTPNHFSLVNHQTVYLHLSHVMFPPRLA